MKGEGEQGDRGNIVRRWRADNTWRALTDPPTHTHTTTTTTTHTHHHHHHHHPPTQMLSNFHAFTSSLPFDLRGETIGQQNSIRNSHNKFARPEPFVAGKKETAGDDDDVFHFVAYVPGPTGAAKAYELDGLQTGPIALGQAAAAAGAAAGAEGAGAEAGAEAAG